MWRLVLVIQQLLRLWLRHLTLISAKLSDETEKERLNPYVLKERDGYTALYLALKSRYMKTASSLVDANQQTSFLANENGISTLYLAVEAVDV